MLPLFYYGLKMEAAGRNDGKSKKAMFLESFLEVYLRISQAHQGKSAEDCFKALKRLENHGSAKGTDLDARPRIVAGISRMLPTA